MELKRFFFFVMFGLFFFVIFGLARISLLDSRAKHGNDRGEEKNTEKTEEKKRTRE